MRGDSRVLNARSQGGLKSSLEKIGAAGQLGYGIALMDLRAHSRIFIFERSKTDFSIGRFGKGFGVGIETS